MRSSRCAALLLVLVGAIAAPGAAPQEQSVPGPSSPAVLPPPLPAGPAPDLDLVFTAEVAGYVEPCG
jgi:hypothetical protein